MSGYRLAEGLYLYPTPAGAYYAASSKEKDKPRQFLRALLQQAETPELSIQQLQYLTGIQEAEKCLELLYHCQKLGLVQGLGKKKSPPSGTLEQLLPAILGKISENSKVLLADNQGFYLANHGFVHEAAEELSALCTEIATVHDRRSGLLINNLGINSHAWAIVNAGGSSQAGFWPLFIGETRFLIAIFGVPHFNQPEFVELVWMLSIRYAENPK
ncbi:MAG: hypothetical protein ACXWUD_04030 [Methylosarcina sp.]